MAKQDIPLNLNIKELARQLRQPTGQLGKQVGLKMNKGNREICLNTYIQLQPKKGDKVLEIGMGNGLFIPNLLAIADKLQYTGIDLSTTMVEEARLNNRSLIDNKRIEILEGRIESLPFIKETFDCITTTNTIYFWANPTKDASELWRVLKLDGKLVIGYRSKKYMEDKAITKHGFQTYSTIELESILYNAGFRQIQTIKIKESKIKDEEGNDIQKIGCFTSGYKKKRNFDGSI